MEIIFEVPAERAAFMLEMLQSMSFVRNPRPRAESAEAEEDATAYLLSSPANAERLRLAYEQFDQGQRVDFTPPAE